MMSKQTELKDLINAIQLKTGYTLEQIGARCDLKGNYLSQAMGMQNPSSKIINKLSFAFADELAGVSVVKEDAHLFNPKKDQGLTMQALTNLTESNRLLAESNRILATSHAELVLMVKEKSSSTAGVDQQTLLETVGTVLSLRELLAEVASIVKKQPVELVQQDLDKKVKAAISKNVRTGSVPAGGS